MPKPTKLGKINFSSLSLPETLVMSQMIDNVNILGGHSGEVELSNRLNLGGHKISNVGAAESPKDVVTSEVAEKNYSAAALRPHLEGSGKVPLRTYMAGLKGDVTASGPGVVQATVQELSGITIDEIAGNLTLTQLPTAGLSVTIVTAQLTTLGATGSMTFSHGLLVAQTQAT